MADFSEMLFGNAQKATDTSDIGDTYFKVAQIGLQKENVQQKRAELEQQKAQLDEAKISKVFQYVGDANKFKNVRDRNNYLKMGISYARSMGIDQNRIPDAALTGLASDEMMGRMATMQRRLFDIDGRPKTPNAVKEFETWLNSPKLQAATPITPPEFMNTDADFQASLEKRMQMDNAMEVALATKDKSQDAINQRFYDAQRERLSKLLSTSGISDLDIAFKNMDNFIPNGINGWREGDRIPGVSGFENNIPINKLPKDSQGYKVRIAAATLGNALLKSRSGLNVTDQERVNVIVNELGLLPAYDDKGGLVSVGTKGTGSPEKFIFGMQQALAILNNRKELLKRGHHMVWDSVYDNSNSIESQSDESQSDNNSTKFVEIGGKKLDRKKVEKLIENNPNDPRVPALKKALGK